MVTRENCSAGAAALRCEAAAEAEGGGAPLFSFLMKRICVGCLDGVRAEGGGRQAVTQ